jgi:hypothetical protein
MDVVERLNTRYRAGGVYPLPIEERCELFQVSARNGARFGSTVCGRNETRKKIYSVSSPDGTTLGFLDYVAALEHFERFARE